MLLAEISEFTALIVIPVAITILIGFPISLYASFVCARLILFSQCRRGAQRALDEVAIAVYSIGSSNLRPFDRARTTLVQAALDLEDFGHRWADWEVEDIRREAQYFYSFYVKRFRELAEANYRAIELNDTREPQMDIDTLREELSKDFGERDKRWRKTIRSLQCDYLTILGFGFRGPVSRWFGPMLRRGRRHKR